jgi:hypothetical protein
LESTQDHLPNQLGQSTKENQVINAFSFTAEMIVRIPGPFPSQQIVLCEHTTFYHQQLENSDFHRDFCFPQEFLWETAFSSQL